MKPAAAPAGWIRIGLVSVGWILGIGLLLLVAADLTRRSQPQWPTAVLPNGNRLRVASVAYAASTNLTAPPHKVLGLWRSGLPLGMPAATESGLPELLVMFEQEGRKGRRSFVPAGGADRMVLLDARDTVASVGQPLGGFGSAGPVWETQNRVFSFGSLSNQGPILRLALQVSGPTNWTTLVILSVTNPVSATGAAIPAGR